ncbi:MAG: suppressor of fused domain protein [Kofleriaceae bacterium]
MTDEPEGGSRLYRHTERMRVVTASGADLALLDAIVAHMTAQVGKPTHVIHELNGEAPPNIDVHVIPPIDEPVITLFTTGMSDHLMTLPPEVSLPRRAELILRLPEGWPISEEALADPRTGWPFRWLRLLARIPHRYDSWLAPTHTIPNGDPPRPLTDDTKQCCMLTVPPICVEDAADVVSSPSGPIMLLSVMPIYEAEMRFKLERGANALIERLSAAGIDDVVDLQRRSVC